MSRSRRNTYEVEQEKLHSRRRSTNTDQEEQKEYMRSGTGGIHRKRSRIYIYMTRSMRDTYEEEQG